MEATYHEIVSVPIGNSGRQIEVFERIPGFKVRLSLFVAFGGHSGDFIMHDNEVPRRFGFDDLQERFFGGLVESFFVDIVGVLSFVLSVGEFAVFGEVSILDDVCSSRGESRARFARVWRWFDAGMFASEIEESTVFDVTPSGEDDKGMVMRTGEVFLTGFFMTFGMFVEFFASDDVCNTLTMEFLFEEINKFLVVEISIGVRDKNASGADTKFFRLRHDGEKGGFNVTPPLGIWGFPFYIKAGSTSTR